MLAWSTRSWRPLNGASTTGVRFDEAHRSIFNRFNEVIEYFDARMIDLTATPAYFIDRDTSRSSTPLPDADVSL
ncbi:MAG: DEAD/DEAH box helicase family protein [Candidatus Latescibacteria bacterium]|nr:DEAD/DEAH box helicase family protein [Candidatus Latescibacterota bacterium]